MIIILHTSLFSQINVYNSIQNHNFMLKYLEVISNQAIKEGFFMITVGIIVEYNPLHEGHIYHIKKAKELTNADRVIAIMSGNYVQRGVPAFLNKSIRTKAAIFSGVDLVIELPFHYSSSSAELFAFASVKLLHELRIVDYIVFGSECDDISSLTNIAKVLLDEPVAYSLLLKSYLKKGLSYPKARMNAFTDYLDNPYYKEILSHPNNILGIEYIKALLSLKSKIKPLTLERIHSSYHDENISEKGYFSASSFRANLNTLGNLPEIKTNIKDQNSLLFSNIFKDIYSKEYNKTFPIVEDDFSIILGEKLISHTKDSLSSIYDIGNDLANRIYESRYEFKDYKSFSEQLKTKNITQTNINRALIHILLDLTKKDMQNYIKKGTILYIRVLGFNSDSKDLLSLISKNTSLPLITKPITSLDTLKTAPKSMLLQSIKADDIYRLVSMNKFKNIISNEYNTSLVITSTVK